MEGQRRIAAQRMPTYDSALEPTFIKQRRDISDRVLLRILFWIVRVVALAVAAQIPNDDPVLVLEGPDLVPPHLTGRSITVRQQDGRSLTMVLVVETHAVAR